MVSLYSILRAVVTFNDLFNTVTFDNSNSNNDHFFICCG